jgi:hypothetical protein
VPSLLQIHWKTKYCMGKWVLGCIIKYECLPSSRINVQMFSMCSVLWIYHVLFQCLVHSCRLWTAHTRLHLYYGLCDMCLWHFAVHILGTLIWWPRIIHVKNYFYVSLEQKSCWRRGSLKKLFCNSVLWECWRNITSRIQKDTRMRLKT